MYRKRSYGKKKYGKKSVGFSLTRSEISALRNISSGWTPKGKALRSLSGIRDKVLHITRTLDSVNHGFLRRFFR